VLSRLAVGVRVDGDDDELELELELELESGNSQLLEVYELHSHVTAARTIRTCKGQHVVLRRAVRMQLYTAA
jgi:hypothetical protein